MQQILLLLSIASVALACGGQPGSTDASTSADSTTDSPDAPADAEQTTGTKLGGQAIGIKEPVRLRATVGSIERSILVTEDGAFHFPGRFETGLQYQVSVDSTRCKLVDAAGTIGTATIDTIRIYCVGVVQLAALVPTSTIFAITPAFHPERLQYQLRRPFFADDSDLVSFTPTAQYPGESTIEIGGVVVASGAQTTPQPMSSARLITLTHPTGLSATYELTMFNREPFFEVFVKASSAVAGAQFSAGYDLQVTCGKALGNGVATSNATIVVGAPCFTTAAGGLSGSIFGYRRSVTGWVTEAVPLPPGLGASEFLGTSVAIDGDTLVAGAIGHATSPNTRGRAYVFVRTGSTWAYQATLETMNTSTELDFGRSVAISGDTIIVGAPGDDGSQVNSGAAYVFIRAGNTWSEQAILKPTGLPRDAAFGWSVAISANTVAVGAPTVPATGAVFVFTRSGTAWTQQQRVVASNEDVGDAFGTSLSLDGDLLAIGAPKEDSNGAAGPTNNSMVDAGAVYVFARTGSTWSLDINGYVKASSPDIGDQFGTSVGIDRVHLLVGASREDGDGNLVDAAPDNNAVDAGAAYAFRRLPTGWSALARHYVKAPNSDDVDRFGSSVAVDGDTFAVGAPLEDSSATGVGPLQDNEATSNAGAVYVFR